MRLFSPICRLASTPVASEASSTPSRRPARCSSGTSRCGAARVVERGGFVFADVIVDAAAVLRDELHGHP